LAPIFDVNPSPERIRRLKTAIADREDASSSVELLMESAFYMEIRDDEAAGITAEIAKTIENNWEKLAREGGMTRDEIEAFRPAFQHDEAQYAKNIGKKKTLSMEATGLFFRVLTKCGGDKYSGAR
jgi:serine/threonine-protein kinase HipA